MIEVYAAIILMCKTSECSYIAEPVPTVLVCSRWNPSRGTQSVYLNDDGTIKLIIVSSYCKNV